MKAVSTRQIWKIAYPILVSLIAEHLILMTDTAFLGRVGEIELGASALAGVFFLAIFMIGFGFSMGAQILIGRRNGEKHFADIGPLVIQGGFFLGFLGLLAFFFTRLFAPVILKELVASGPVYVAVVRYLDWRSLGFFPAFICLIFRAYYVGIGQTRVLTASSFLMVAVNVLLNYLLIFGEWGFPKMGIGGAALASGIAESVAMFFFILYTRGHTDLDKYGFSGSWGFKAALVRRILDVGVWIMIQYLVGVAIWFVFFVAVEHLGERAIAVSNITRSILTLMFMPIFALASTSVSLTSNLIGAGKQEQVWRTCWKVIRLCLLMTMPVALVIFVFPDFFARIYTDQADLVAGSRAAIRVAVTSLVIAVPALILFQTISGTGNTRTALLLDLGPMLVVSLFIYGVIFHLKADVAACWLNEHIYWGCVLAVSWVYMRTANWQHKPI
ncbi:MAG: MATE family efflux transporter [Alistipes senegalensis]|nr:MATE family efflux transporter [Oxalobacter formigenes]MCM1281065.1 MATE family efflux transporter [Alistipes senegalensis]